MTGDSFKTAEKLSEIAKENGILVAFNPSSYLVEKGRKYLSKMLKNSDVLIFNKEEAAILVEKGTDTKGSFNRVDVRFEKLTNDYVESNPWLSKKS